HPSGCISRDTVMVYVYDSVPALHTITDTMMCNPADSIRFEDNTAYNNAIFKDFGKGKVEWFFGDTASPASGYAVGSDVRYAYGGFGKFVCKQVVTTPYGCILDTVEQPIRIFPISAFGTVFNPAPPLPPEGCVPFKIDVMSVFDSLKTSSPIVDYIWKWDYAKTATDTTHSGSQEFETHTYTDTGTFEVYATLINQQGCTADIYVETVRVGVEPAAYFTYQFIQGCRNEIGLQVQAYDSLQGGGLLGAAGANGWEWYDVENPFFPIATGQTASLAFSEKIGYQGLVLIPKHNGCAGASIFADSVAYLCPPIAKINYPQNYPDGTPPVFCEYPLIYFENGSVGWTKSEWYMGDTLNGIPAFAGQTKFEQYALYDGITGNPLPNYPDPDPSFDYAPLNPLTQDTNFYLYKNQGMVLITLKAYNGDSLSNEFLPDGTTLHPTYNRCKYCEDTATQIVLISNALMNFVADRNEVCQGNSVEFIDSTFCLITLTGWGIKVLSAENPSTAEYPVGQFIEMNLKPQVGQGFLLPFEVPNVYEFVLYDTCAFGCVRNDTLQVTAWTRSIPAFTTSKTPNNPSSFNTSPDTLCLNNPDTLYFKDSSTTAYPFNYLNIVQWVWEFSNIGIDSLFGYEVSAVPVNYGFSDVKLTITNEKGCDSSIVMQNRFRTDYVEARFSTYAKTYCNNVNINFTNQSTVFPQIQHESPWGNTSITCEWDWGDGTPRERQNIICGTRPNLSHTYYLPDKETVVYITLKVWMTNNPSCESIFVDSITIIRPIADFTDDGHIFPCPGPTGKEITFTSTSDGRISTYTWNFGDKWCDPNDNLAVGPSPEFKVVTHTYKKAGYYDVTLMVEDSAQGCVDIMYKPRYVFIDGPAGTFEYTPTSGCVDFRVDFQAYIDDDQYGYPTADSIGWIFDGISIFWRKGAAVALPYAYAYQTPGAYIPMLQLVKTVDNNGTMERCVVIEVGEDTIWAIDLMPDFIADSLYGLEVPVEFENTTTVMPPVLSADSVYWDYGNNDSQWIYNPAKNAANGYTMYDSEGIYTVALTAYYKLCNQSKTYVIGVKEGVGISNYELGINNYIIYPNPTTGKITVESCKVYKVESVELFDVVGKQYSVGAKHVLPNDEMVIDISHLANGMYFIKIQTDNGTVMKKVVKE
ncbi:MAG: PKD domain-containing protein, partial [Lentimicrobiaceae bacterium]|nr:PKD domain-containing protein [Lentimicrobiaceae bacterium]